MPLVASRSPFWLPAPSLEGAGDTFNEGQEGPDVALAGLVLALALERVRASVTQRQAGKRDGVRDRWGQKDDERRCPR